MATPEAALISSWLVINAVEALFNVLVTDRRCEIKAAAVGVIPAVVESRKPPAAERSITPIPRNEMLDKLPAVSFMYSDAVHTWPDDAAICVVVSYLAIVPDEMAPVVVPLKRISM